MQVASDNPDYIVVGGGLSGLYAAYRLLKNNKDVVVLEAGDRVGGRILTKHLSHDSHELPVDLGAQWIGEDHHRLIALACALGLSIVPTPQPSDVAFDLFKRNGVVGPPFFNSIVPVPAEAWPLSNLMSFIEASKVSRAVDELGKSIRSRNLAQRPWDLPDSGELDKSFMSWVGGITDDAKVTDYTRFLISAAYCHDAKDLSALGIATHVLKCGGTRALDNAERYVFRYGSSGLPLVLANALGERVRLNAPVKAIQQSGLQVSVDTGDRIWKAKRAIVAVPPVLASKIKLSIENDEESRAKLLEKVALLKDLKQGKVAKYVVAYESAFWREKGQRARYIGDSTEIDMVFDATPQDQCAPGKLACFVRGANAEGWMTWSSGDRRETVLRTLASYMDDDQAMNPIAFCEHDWTGDPLSCGGFGAVYQPGVLTAHRTPLSEQTGRIHWAGTETANEWPNYMEGALEAAIRAVKEVLKAA